MKSIKDQVFVIIDTETTGIRPVKKDSDNDSFVPDDIVEIAAGYFQYGKEIKIASSLIDPKRHIPFMSSAVHHIIDEDVVGKPTYETYMEKLIKRFPEDAVFVAHNARFDKAFLRPVTVNEKTVNLADDNNWMCTFRMAKLLFDDMESYSNQGLRYELGLDIPRDLETHRAGGDVLVTSKILEKEIDAYLELGLDDNIESFLKFSEQYYTVKSLPNGKYRDVPLEDVVKKDRSYLIWYRDNMEAEVDIIESVKNIIIKHDKETSDKKSKQPKFKF